jgi:hypothetical protein
MISINVLLDDGFEGGGTQFWNRAEEKPFAHVQPTQVGQVLVHSAFLNHEGMPLERGRRTIFVGFLEVDRVEPFSEQGAGRQTGLSWFSSWGCLPFLINKTKQGYQAARDRLQNGQDDWKNSVYIRSFFGTAHIWLSYLVDVLFPHFVCDMVEDANRASFLSTLDSAYYEERQEGGQGQGGGEAKWFDGQGTFTDINGKSAGSWSTRQAHNDGLDEL